MYSLSDLEDLGRFQHPAYYEYDVCFVGWISSSLAEMVVNVVEAAPGLNSFVRRREAYFDFVPETDKNKRKQRLEFISALQKSRLSLCPANEHGHIRRRFWEALSMGRIPVLIDDQIDLSQWGEYDWNNICLVVPEAKVMELPEILKAYLSTNKDLGLQFRGILARQVWEKVYEDCSGDTGV